MALVDVRPAELEAAAEAVRAEAGSSSAVSIVADLARPEECASAVAPSATSQVANAFAFIARSISMYRFVVGRVTDA